MKIDLLVFSTKLGWGSYIVSTAKTDSKKIGVLIHFIKFLSFEVVLSLYESAMWSCKKFWDTMEVSM